MARGVRSVRGENTTGAEPDVMGVPMPLFPDVGVEDDVPSKVSVSRVTPNDGFLASAEPSITEDWLREEYGGGTYELVLRNAAGGQLGHPRRIKIAGAPLARGEIEQKEIEKEDRAATAESLAALQSKLFREQLSMMKAEAESARERAKLELELSLRQQRAEADERETRERQRFEREMARERERAEREREREAAQRQADADRHKEFLVSMQALQKEQTSVMIAALQDRSRGSDPLEVVERMLPLLDRGGVDPDLMQAQQAWATVNKGLDLAAAATGGGGLAGLPGRSAKEALAKVASGAAAVKTGGSDLGGDLKGRLASVLGKVKASGADVGEVLKQLDEGKLTLVPTEWVSEAEEAIAELDSRGESAGKVKEDGQPEPAAMEDGGRGDKSGADESAVVPRARGNGNAAAS